MNTLTADSSWFFFLWNREICPFKWSSSIEVMKNVRIRWWDMCVCKHTKNKWIIRTIEKRRNNLMQIVFERNEKFASPAYSNQSFRWEQWSSRYSCIHFKLFSWYIHILYANICWANGICISIHIKISSDHFIPGKEGTTTNIAFRIK